MRFAGNLSTIFWSIKWAGLKAERAGLGGGRRSFEREWEWNLPSFPYAGLAGLFSLSWLCRLAIRPLLPFSPLSPFPHTPSRSSLSPRPTEKQGRLCAELFAIPSQQNRKLSSRLAGIQGTKSLLVTARLTIPRRNPIEYRAM